MSRRKTNRGGHTAASTGKHTGAKIIVGVAFLLAIVYVITSLALGIRAGAPVWNPLKWVNRDTVQGEQGGDDETNDPGLTPGGYAAIDESGSLMRSGIIYTMPKSFAFIGENEVTPKTGATPAAVVTPNSDSVTITATVTPENASDKRVTWSSDSRYVTVTPLSDGSNIATVTLTDYSPSVFSESAATISCTSVSNPEAFGTCEVTRLATGDEINLFAEVKAPMLFYGDEVRLETRIEGKNGPDGLYYGEIGYTKTAMSIVVNTELFTEINNQLAAAELDYDVYNQFTYECLGSKNSVSVLINSPAEMFYDIHELDSDCTKFNNAFMRGIKNNNGNNSLNFQVNIQVSIGYEYKGINFGEITTTITDYIKLDELWVEVGDVEIGGDIVVTP